MSSIDQSFIKSLNQDDQTIVKTIISMGKNLGMRIVAEGVENERQQDLLLSFDCDIIQGYYRHKPVDAKEIEGVLKKTSDSLNIKNTVPESTVNDHPLQ